MAQDPTGNDFVVISLETPSADPVLPLEPIDFRRTNCHGPSSPEADRPVLARLREEPHETQLEVDNLTIRARPKQHQQAVATDSASP
jgi:hypothetical protein